MPETRRRPSGSLVAAPRCVLVVATPGRGMPKPCREVTTAGMPALSRHVLMT